MGMESAVTSLGIGFAFGLALAVPPGPINAIIAEESVSHGIRPGVRAGLGAMSADICFLVLAAIGLGPFLLARPTIQAAMIGIGGLLMLYFGYAAIRDAVRGSQWAEGPQKHAQGFRKTFVLSITNPYQFIFWMTVGLTLLRPDRIDIGGYLPLISAFVIETGRPLLFVGLFGGVVVWIVAFPVSLHVVGRRIDRFAPIVSGASAVILLAFGSVFLLEALSSFW